GIEKSDIRRGQVRDTDGDGHADARAVAGGKALEDVVKHSDQPESSAARLGDPIPGIDLACAPLCRSALPQVGTAVQGAPRQRTAGSDGTQESVPALEPNPLP